jgi:hypothetical protein
MTTEELMKPRWKVIADYPNSPFFIGQVFTIPNFDNQFTKDYWAAEKNKYPNIFEPLPWWKERKVEDMPEYVRHTASGKTWKVKEYDLPTGAHLVGNEISSYWAVMKNLVPATESDYNAYLQTTNQNNGQ